MSGLNGWKKLVAAFKQAAFGRRSEKSDPDQFELALEDLETAIAVIHAEDLVGKRAARPRAANRESLPKHLLRIEEVIEPDSLTCACGGCLHCIGEDVSERLGIARQLPRKVSSSSPITTPLRPKSAVTIPQSDWPYGWSSLPDPGQH